MASNQTDAKLRLEFDGKTPELWIGYQAKFEARLRQIKRVGVTKKYFKKTIFQPNSISGFMLFDALSDKPGGFDDNDEPFWSERQVRDQRALFDNIMATQAMNSPLITQLSGFAAFNDCGVRAWKFLLQMFRSRMEESIGLRISQLTSIQQSDGETLDEYSQRAATMLSELRQLGRPQEDASSVNHILTGLREEYNTIRGVWRMTIAQRRRSGQYDGDDEIETGMKDLLELMREEAEATREREVRSGKVNAAGKQGTTSVQSLKAILKTKGIDVSHKQVVNMTRMMSKGKKKVGKRYGPGSYGNYTDERTCHRCGRKGHIKVKCFAKTHKNGKPLTDDPPAKKPDNTNPVEVNTTKVSQNTEAETRTAVKNVFAGLMASLMAAVTSADDIVQIFLSKPAESATSVPFILDSGATHTCTPYKSDLTSIRNLQQKVRIAYGEGESGDIVRAGTLRGCTSSLASITAFHAPKLKHRLLSYADLEDHNFTVDIAGRSIRHSHSTESYPIVRVNRLYIVWIPLEERNSIAVNLSLRSGRTTQVTVSNGAEGKFLTESARKAAEDVSHAETDAPPDISTPPPQYEGDKTLADDIEVIPNDVQMDESPVHDPSHIPDDARKYIYYDVDTMDTPSLSELYKYLVVSQRTATIWTKEEKENFSAHLIMNHASRHLLGKMKKAGLLPAGVHFHEHADTPGCKACLLAGTHRQPANRKPAEDDDELQPGEMLVCDLWGPVAVPSIHGHRYMLCAIDPCRKSGWSGIRGLNLKSDAPRELENILVFLSSRSTPRITRHIRFDQDSVFTSDKMNQMLNSRSIHSTFSAPYVHSQVGKAERLQGLLAQKASTCLIAAQSPLRYWMAAMTYANYTRNVTPQPAYNMVIPIKAVDPTTNYIPITEVPPFGTPCFVHLSDAKSKDITKPIAFNCVLLGVSEYSRSYLVHNLATDNVLCTHHVKFDYHAMTASLTGPRTVGTNLLGRIPTDLEDRAPPPEPPESAVDKATWQWRSQSGWQQVAHLLIALEDDAAFDMGVGGVAALVSNAGVFSAKFHQHPVPENVHEALATDGWREATQAEFNRIVELMAAFRKVARSEVERTNGVLYECDWRFDVKTDENGNVIQLKARLVGRGDKQVEVQLDPYSPTGSKTSLRILLARGYKYVEQFDAPGAYLQAEATTDGTKQGIDLNIYVNQIPGFEDGTDDVYKMDHPLYGFVEAGKLWWLKVDGTLIIIGAVRSVADPCVYIFSHRVTDNIPFVIWMWVDNIFAFTNNKDDIQWLLEQLKTHGVNIKLVSVANALGCKVILKDTWTEITMEKYIDKLHDRYLKNAQIHPVKVPLPQSYQKTRDNDTRTLTGTERGTYLSLTASMLHAYTTARPDIGFAVHVLTRKMHSPTGADLVLADHLLRYLITTREYGIVYAHGKRGTQMASSMYGAVDADFGGDNESRRSISGVAHLYRGAAVHWSCKLQAAVTTNSTDAELYAMMIATKDTIWLRQLLKDIGDEQYDATEFDGDNKAAISVVSTDAGMGHSGTRHACIRRAFVRENVKRKITSFSHVGTAFNYSDVFTKALDCGTFTRHRAKLLGSSSNSTSEKAMEEPVSKRSRRS